jgi:hypothetical protein
MWLVRLAGLFGRRRRDRELDEELVSHLAMETDDLVRRGVAPDEARRLALVHSGGVEAAKEAYREQRGVRVLSRTWQTLQHAAHRLRRSPGYSLAVIASLALGLGLTTSIYGVVDAVLRKPLPFADPDGLLAIGVLAIRDEPPGSQDFTARGPGWQITSHNLTAWRDNSTTIGAFATYSAAYHSVVGEGIPEHSEGAYASASLLPHTRRRACHWPVVRARRRAGAGRRPGSCVVAASVRR